MTINPIRLELIKNALVMVSDNMMVSVLRTSRSTLVKSNMDFSASILDADGDMVAQGLALPGHLGATMPALRGCLDHFGGDIEPGDILASNDPYAGASHLNDIFMFRPVYKDGERICILGLILHHTDLGGRVAGGQAADSNEIYQEGLRIPPSKIYVRDEPNDTLIRLIEHNTRVPDKVLGDVRAQIAALIAGEAEILKLTETNQAPAADEVGSVIAAVEECQSGTAIARFGGKSRLFGSTGGYVVDIGPLIDLGQSLRVPCMAKPGARQGFVILRSTQAAMQCTN